MLRPFVEDLGRVREELGAERVQQAERDRDELRIRLEALQESPQTPETSTEEPERTVRNHKAKALRRPKSTGPGGVGGSARLV